MALGATTVVRGFTTVTGATVTGITATTGITVTGVAGRAAGRSPRLAGFSLWRRVDVVSGRCDESISR